MKSSHRRCGFYIPSQSLFVASKYETLHGRIDVLFILITLVFEMRMCALATCSNTSRCLVSSSACSSPSLSLWLLTLQGAVLFCLSTSSLPFYDKTLSPRWITLASLAPSCAPRDCGKIG